MAAKEVTFAADISNQVVVVRPADEYKDKDTHRLVSDMGERIEFEQGIYRTSNEAYIALLRDRAAAGRGPRIQELPDVVPEPTTELAALATAEEITEVQAILDAELEGHNRPVVVDTARSLLARSED